MTPKDNFEKRFGLVYVPENADLDDDSEDIYTFEDFEKLCSIQFSEYPNFRKIFKSEEHLLMCLIDTIEWEFPETILDQFNNFN